MNTKSVNTKTQTLRDFWYPLIFSDELNPYQPHSVQLFGKPLVLFRDREGQPHCLQNSCPHRAFPLSEGKVRQGEIECPYHGWRFDGTGQCTHIPTLTKDEKIPPTACVHSLSTIEQKGIVWVWAGSSKTPDPKTITIPETPPDFANFLRCDDFDCHYSLVVQNIVDPAHFFLHRHSITWMFESPVTPFVWSHVRSLSDGFEAEATSFGLTGSGSVNYRVRPPIILSQKGLFPFLDLLVLADYFIVPLSQRKTRGFVFIRMGGCNIPQFVTEMMLSLFQISVHMGVEEDKQALRIQQQNLDLGMTGYAATPQDRMLLFYEKWRQKLDDNNLWY